MRFIAIVVPAVVTLSCATPTAPMDSPPDRARGAVQQLRDQGDFVSARLGYAGVLSARARAWRIVADDPRADTLFKELLAVGAPGGRIYGLMGVCLTDKVRCDQERARWPNAEIEVKWGCVWQKEDLRRVVADALSPGAMREFTDSTRWELEVLDESDFNETT